VGVLLKSQAVALPEVQWWRSSHRAYSGARPTKLGAQIAQQAAAKPMNARITSRGTFSLIYSYLSDISHVTPPLKPRNSYS
jgi:hypothetical protein